MLYWPDGDKTQPNVLFSAESVAHNNNGAYERVYAAQASGYAALTTGRVLGSAIVKNLTGTAKLYAGSTTKIYQADGAGGWTDRSGGTTFGATSWSFASFGDYVVAANGVSKLQAATTGNFADIADAPAAKIVYPHANALVAFNISANTAAWYRSKTGDHTVWTPTASNDADFGFLGGGIGGPITAGGPWENLALAWKARAMYAGIYVGNGDPDQDVIRWQLVSSDVGCVSQFAWIATEVGIVFVSERGIMLFNGNKPFNIDDRIRKTFMADAMVNRSRIFCTLDEGNNHVYVWVSPSGANCCSTAYIWNYKTQEWGMLRTISDATAVTFRDPKTPVRNANYRDIVAIGGFATNTTETANLWFDDNNDRLINLAGTTYNSGSGDGFLRTGRIGDPTRDTRLTRVHLVTDAYQGLAGTCTLTVNTYPDAVTAGTSASSLTINHGQWFDVQLTARFFELQFTLSGTTGKTSVLKAVCEFEDAGPQKKPFQIVL